jgi:hypothetical protein
MLVRNGTAAVEVLRRKAGLGGIVIAGLDPAIHLASKNVFRED